ncbi:hypothetical protein EWM64_g1163 [Hericium alpestre]|uniref:Laccase n=1 Tax=Hericium alpestre TaxID=135208 RepID=A0A4Z0A938_9AGAM|nr:hypothetical protein EWM64_g1163 [Hericium alpestre]
MRSVAFSLAALVSAVAPALAGVHEVWWNITYVQDANPDGLFPRQVIGVNGTWPPPPIEVSTNDTLLVHAFNSLDEPMTLHHHGMFFNSTSWMDGAQGVSQCGIPPGQSWDYHVPVNESGQWGTYWIHSHAGGQYVDGLRTSLVLHPPKETHQYDEEFTVILGDWYHDQHHDLLDQFINVATPVALSLSLVRSVRLAASHTLTYCGRTDSALIYFAQNGSYFSPIDGTTPEGGVTSHVGFNENGTLPFVPGRTYRLRIVNTSAFAAFFFWIDGHEMRIIEADGTDVEESPSDLLSLTVAQRYSVLVTARNDTNANWVIHANMDTDMFDTVPDALQPNITSSITYSPDAPLTDLGPIDEYADVDDLSLVPVQVEAMPPATSTIELEVMFDTMQDGTNHAMFNLVTWNMPLVPAVLSELTLGENATAVSAYGPNAFVINHLDVFDIVLKNGDAGKHPFS